MEEGLTGDAELPFLQLLLTLLTHFFFLAQSWAAKF